MSSFFWVCMLRTRESRSECDLDPENHCRSGCRKSRLRRGTAAIEFALVAPVFFLLVFGLIELGRMVMVQQALTNAAREGCRTATLATTQSNTEVESTIRNFLNSVMHNASSADEVRVTVPSELASTAAGTDLTVAVEVDYADVSWLPLQYLGLNPTIAAQQVGRRE
jgi:Flp pilus assembly protein TadG